MVRVKICGITNLEDALLAIGEGADALGFIFAPSPRRIEVAQAREIIGSLPPFTIKVGVFVNAGAQEIRETMQACGLDVVQFHGSEPPEAVAPFFPRSIKAIKMRDRSCISKIPLYHVGAVLLDSYDPGIEGGTGKSFNWEWAREAGEAGAPVILSGGLDPGNIAEAIRIVSPYAVDVASGVEKSPGKKDPEKLKAFIMNAKGIA